jgi:hypothetical protein
MAILPNPESFVRYPIEFEPAGVGPNNWNAHLLGRDALALTGYEASVFLGQRGRDVEQETRALVVANRLTVDHEVVREELAARFMNRRIFL